MRYILLVLALWLVSAFWLPFSLLSNNEKHLEIALSYEGYKEKKGNRGEFVDYINRRAKVRLGSPYCATFVKYCLDSARTVNPKRRTGLAINYITNESMSAIDVFYNKIEIPRGSLVVWQRGNSTSGHVGFTTKKWKGQNGYTIEANTSSGKKGSQSDGDGIYKRRRKIEPLNFRFRIIKFTLVTYATA